MPLLAILDQGPVPQLRLLPILSDTTPRHLLPSIRPRKPTFRPTSVLAAAVVFASSALAAGPPPSTLPYVATTILLAPAPAAAPNASTVAYIIRPELGDGSIEFLRLDYSTIATGSISEGTSSLGALSPAAPRFLSGNRANDGGRGPPGFAPVVTDDGAVTVYVAECDGGEAAVWTLRRIADDGHDDNDNDDEWEWTMEEVDTSQDDDDNDAPFTGPGYLGATIAFSSQLQPSISPPRLYSYGGMCPSAELTSDVWQFGANYSNAMSRLSAPVGDGASSAVRTLSPISVRGPAVASAGFTLTPLPSSITNNSGIVTQQTQHVLLGGHTQQAFINMSTAAVWNLPEESWTFVGINPPSTQDPPTQMLNSDEPAAGNVVVPLGGKTAKGMKRDLTIDIVDSRSGHTAVLSEDGKSIVVLGGWVGDIAQAAQPQLAILEMEGTYRDWRWVVPDAQPEEPAVYGHGAAVLPGNVMMVYGGYDITDSATQRLKSKKRQTWGEPLRFLNLTSMEWDDSYTRPSDLTTASDDSHRPTAGGGEADTGTVDETEHEHGLRIGLGVGLGIGIPLLIITLGTLYLCRGRWREKRRRDKAVRALAQDATHFIRPDTGEREKVRESLPKTVFSSWSPSGWYTGGPDPYQRGERSLEGLQSQSNYGGTFGTLGTPALRKPAPRVQRGLYQPTVSHTASLTPGPGTIHPIYEDDEDEKREDPPGVGCSTSREQRDSITEIGPLTPVSQTHTDPFASPKTPAQATWSDSRASATPSPERGLLERDPEVQGWKTDVDAADALLSRMNSRHSQSRTLPVRRSSMQSSHDNRDRDGQRYDDDMAGGDYGGAAAGRASECNRSERSFRRSLSVKSVKNPKSGGYTALTGGSSPSIAPSARDVHQHSDSPESNRHTYDTARSSFGALQAEGPSLLLGQSFDDQDADDAPGSPSKNRLRRGWLGSLRRALSSAGFRGLDQLSSASSMRSYSPDRVSGDGVEVETEAFDRSHLAELSGLAGGGSVLKHRQGRQAWEDARGYVDSGDLGDSSAGHTGMEPGEDEWDIERAVEERLVQVVFTVPREKLRVVNVDEVEEEAVVVVEGDSDGLQDFRDLRDTAQTRLDGRDLRPQKVREGRLDGGGHESEQERPDESPCSGPGPGPGLGLGLGLSQLGRQTSWGSEADQPRDKGKGRQTKAPNVETEMCFDNDKGEEAAVDDEGEDDVDSTRTLDHLGVGEDGARAVSPASFALSGDERYDSTLILTAEAVTMERQRPRTRVLEIVEGIEGRGKGSATPPSASSSSSLAPLSPARSFESVEGRR